MVQLTDADVRTREVLNWSGVHLLHARGSSCSQKTRIFLNLKGIPWESHEIDLKAGENHTDWYLGINPRGLVPCLVHDGVVHIESNDIIEYLEETFPDPPLIPSDARDRVHGVLEIENDLHADLRVLTFRYVIPTQPGSMKDRVALDRLRRNKGTINGEPDRKVENEVRFWELANVNGISDDQVTRSAHRFYVALNDLDEVLSRSKHCLGEALTAVDIAWYVYCTRLRYAGYPLLELHSNVAGWYCRLDANDMFSTEVGMPEPLRAASLALQAAQREQGRDLRSVAGL